MERGGTQYIKKEKEGMGLEYEGMEGEWEYQEEPESGRGERPGMGREGWERRGGEMRGGVGYQERKCMAGLRRFNE